MNPIVKLDMEYTWDPLQNHLMELLAVYLSNLWIGLIFCQGTLEASRKFVN